MLSFYKSITFRRLSTNSFFISLSINCQHLKKAYPVWIRFFDGAQIFGQKNLSEGIKTSIKNIN